MLYCIVPLRFVRFILTLLLFNTTLPAHVAPTLLIQWWWCCGGGILVVLDSILLHTTHCVLLLYCYSLCTLYMPLPILLRLYCIVFRCFVVTFVVCNVVLLLGVGGVGFWFYYYLCHLLYFGSALYLLLLLLYCYTMIWCIFVDSVCVPHTYTHFAPYLIWLLLFRIAFVVRALVTQLSLPFVALKRKARYTTPDIVITHLTTLALTVFLTTF